MKKILFLLVFLFTTLISIAQQGINFKAVIKDDKGALVTNQKVALKFYILQDETKSIIYSEIHTPFTDTNGIAIVNIGEGMVESGNFSQIIWGNNIYYLQTEVDTGNGLKNIGTSPFNTVPYAFQAQTATKAMNVTGLEALDEGNGFGWRFVGKDPLNYGTIGNLATDLSHNYFPSNTAGATGINSLAVGEHTIASGVLSTAMGSYSTASGLTSTAIGTNAIASGRQSFALGTSVLAPSFGEIALGIYNTSYTPNSSSDWMENDRLLVVGNGITNRSDALIILKDGSITAPSLDLNDISDARSLTTKEYVDANTSGGNSSGLEAINEGNGTGWRLKGQLQEFYGNIGLLAVDLSQSGVPTNTYGATGAYSFATGNRSRASGLNSVAMGDKCTASGAYTFASGNTTIASGYASTATGNNTEASAHFSTASGDGALSMGVGSTAMGINTTALKNGSVALGLGTTAHANGEIAVGSYNTNYSPIPTPDWNQANRVFVVGNGYNESNRSNALTIYNNGNVALGNITPSSSTTENVLDVDGRIRLRPKTGSNSTSGIWYSDVGGANRQFAGAKQHNPYWNAARQWGVYIQGWKFWVNGNGDATLTGSLAQNSDKRLKKEITDLSYGLTEILQLQPKQYFWKDRENQEEASLGLIAQEVQKIISNVVHTGADDKKTLSLSYTELIPVLINAIKEQQQIIDNQTKKLDTQDSNYANLLKRLETLEAHNTQDKNITKATLITHKNKK